MVVQHNLAAMNANRMFNITSELQKKSTEKLSSGYKINRAADDAAGLSISEKMRKQIKGLNQATSNAQDGISAVQTAEGALGEVHDMLQRMNELAVKASNGTMSTTDRWDVQREIDSLTQEIDRVAETTKFNEIYLLNGTGAVDSSTGKSTAAELKTMSGDNWTKYKDYATNKTTLAIALHVGADATTNNEIVVEIKKMKTSTIKLLGAQPNATTTRLDVRGTSNTNALKAITSIARAIKEVSMQRSKLGAIQNRLEHTIKNLNNIVENTTAAESAIRDTDMATEMVTYSKNNILAQAGQSMLAQANQSNQGVLSLIG